jgi:hypothetical protein
MSFTFENAAPFGFSVLPDDKQTDLESRSDCAARVRDLACHKKCDVKVETPELSS